MIVVLLSCLLGIVPMVVYAFVLWSFDRYEKEPWGLLLAAFLWGFVPSAAIALIAQLILGIPAQAIFGANAFTEAIVEASFIAPITEEGIKGIGVLMVFLIFRREFDSAFDGILYGGLVGFGFAAIENVLYFFSTGDIGGVVALAFMRAFIFGLNHAFFTSLTGIGLALARYQRSPALKILYILLGFAAAVTAHGLHNLGATYASEVTWLGLVFSWLLDSTGIIFVFVVIILALRREGGWVADHLQEEVRLGTLTESQLSVAKSAPAPLEQSGPLPPTMRRAGLQAASTRQDGRRRRQPGDHRAIARGGEGAESGCGMRRCLVAAFGDLRLGV
ncbi:MAG: PrsW family intramembrane metalloprotease [Chloroflexi bacterium]|nr:PrsW family intramembrane metalloprotease [Chloroflexota bacterium]